MVSGIGLGRFVHPFEPVPTHPHMVSLTSHNSPSPIWLSTTNPPLHNPSAASHDNTLTSACSLLYLSLSLPSLSLSPSLFTQWHPLMAALKLFPLLQRLLFSAPPLSSPLPPSPLSSNLPIIFSISNCNIAATIFFASLLGLYYHGFDSAFNLHQIIWLRRETSR